MNGDEDLGQNIIMKGDKYHYNQQFSQMESTEGGAPSKTGVRFLQGDEKKEEKKEEKKDSLMQTKKKEKKGAVR